MGQNRYSALAQKGPVARRGTLFPVAGERIKAPRMPTGHNSHHHGA
jgi:hypothetical protein